MVRMDVGRLIDSQTLKVLEDFEPKGSVNFIQPGMLTLLMIPDSLITDSRLKSAGKSFQQIQESSMPTRTDHTKTTSTSLNS